MNSNRRVKEKLAHMSFAVDAILNLFTHQKGLGVEVARSIIRDLLLQVCQEILREFLGRNPLLQFLVIFPSHIGLT